MWFSWATPFDIVTAWRKVGIAGKVLKPELIDRSEFIDQPAAAAGGAADGAAADGAVATPGAKRKRSAAELAKTPEGMVSGSVESEQSKVKALLEYAQELEAERDLPFDPKAAGILVPTVVARPAKEQRGAGRMRLSNLHGSVTMRDVGGEAEKRRLEDKAAADAAQEAKRLREEKKEAAEREASERAAAFARC